jgi:ubiquinone/menaquinone biosynthesis C-methylase UbiE
MSLKRVLEPEVMDSEEEAHEYDQMDHSRVNAVFAEDLIAAGFTAGDILDVGTGTALIPIEICRRISKCRIMAVDLSAYMLERARFNVSVHSLNQQIQLAQVDGKKLLYPDAMFDAVISNSIVHHIPEPLSTLEEAARVCRPQGLIFFRDLLRPNSEQHVRDLVEQYAGSETPRARQLFDDSLRAALSLEEIRQLVTQVGFPAESVQQTTDRHWTWSTRK